MGNGSGGGSSTPLHTALVTEEGNMIDSLVPRINTYTGYELEHLIADANADLRYSHALQVTDMDIQYAEDEEGNTLLILLVAVIYSEGEYGI